MIIVRQGEYIRIFSVCNPPLPLNGVHPLGGDTEGALIF